MPKLGKGTECVQLLLSQVSKDMHEPLVPMFFPILGAQVSESEFQYPDLSWKELCGMMGNLVADSGCNKGQLSNIVEAICHNMREHDSTELEKLVEWQKQMKMKSANKEKPARPDVSFWFPPADVTNAAFIQNAMACEKLGERTQYLNLPEVEMADRMCGGHKQISQMLRNIYDRQRSGALRATVEGVTGNPVLRANLTISSTPYAARKFYKNELFNGTFGRMVFSYKARMGRDGRIPRQGKYDEGFYKKLDEYLVKLSICKGRFIIKPLNKLADQLQNVTSLRSTRRDGRRNRMYARFARTLSQLRHEKGVSQREAAQALEVSQALLSHYENGIREPGLAFVVRACDYYQVSADYLLGRLTDRGTGQGASQGPDPAVMLTAADLLTQLCLDLCHRHPETALLFRTLADQLGREVAGERKNHKT